MQIYRFDAQVLLVTHWTTSTRFTLNCICSTHLSGRMMVTFFLSFLLSLTSLAHSTSNNGESHLLLLSTHNLRNRIEMNCHRYEIHFKSEYILCNAKCYTVCIHINSTQRTRDWYRTLVSLSLSNMMWFVWSILPFELVIFSIRNRFDKRERRHLCEMQKSGILCDWLKELCAEFFIFSFFVFLFFAIFQRKHREWYERGTQATLDAIWASIDWVAYPRHRCDDMYAEPLDNVPCTMDSHSIVWNASK